MKQLKLVTSDWWQGMSDKGKQNFVQDNPNHPKSRAKIDSDIRAIDRTQKDREEKEREEQELKDQQLRDEMEKRKPVPEPLVKATPIRRKAPPPKTNNPITPWEIMESRKGQQ